MYIRAVHAELDVPTLQAFVRSHPLGLFTTAVKHDKYDTIQTSHIPFVLDDASSDDLGSPGHLGTLRGHIARQNPQTKALIDTLRPTDSVTLDDDVQVLFNAPVHHYVPPRFYTETKPKDGKIVPTWNYAAVQVYGKLKLHYLNNEESSAFLQKQIEDLSGMTENMYNGSWTVSEAPTKYIDVMKKAIVGIEIDIKRIEGRFKLSQEDLGKEDWKGLVEGFRALGTERASEMADMIEGRARV
jgi:transcriptional regulator